MKSFANRLDTYQFPLSNRCVGCDSINVIEWRLLFLSRQQRLFPFVLFNWRSSLCSAAPLPSSFGISLASIIRCCCWWLWWWWWCRWWWCRRNEFFFLGVLRGELPMLPLLHTEIVLSKLTFVVGCELNIRLIWCTSNDWFTCASLGCNRKLWALKITNTKCVSLELEKHVCELNRKRNTETERKRVKKRGRREKKWEQKKNE